MKPVKTISVTSWIWNLPSELSPVASFRLLLLLLLMAAHCGCRTPQTSPLDRVDSRLVRYQKDAGLAYNEGQLRQATKLYRKALYRAWAIDDPYESGTAAYNLAATLVSRGELEEARQWLINARVDLCRVRSAAVCSCDGSCDDGGRCDSISHAKTSLGNTWLLDSQIAMQQGRYEDAHRYIDRAACAAPPCESAGSSCLCGPGSKSCCGRDCCDRDPCDPPLGSRLPCIGKSIRRKDEAEDCRNGYLAQIQLARARLSANQYDVPAAQTRLLCACELLVTLCDCGLNADRHDVAALIHLAKDEPLRAAAHFDRETDYLRAAETYREIPKILDAAAAAYEMAGRYELAADRLGRSARIWLVRGDLDAAWDRVRTASELAVMAGSQSATIRLTLVAKEIEIQVDREDKMIDEDLELKPELPPSKDPPPVEKLQPPPSNLRETLPSPLGSLKLLLQSPDLT